MRHIRFPRIKIQETGITKTAALKKVEEYVNNNLDNFYDDESIIIDYTDVNGDACASSAIILKGLDEDNKPTAIVKGQLNNDDTLNIIESETEPSDIEAIWLDISDPGSTDDEKTRLKEQVEDLLQKNKELEERILRLEYILTGEYTSKGEYVGGGVVAGGDMLTNSVKYAYENSTESLKPENAVEYGYATDDTAITTFDIYLGNASLNDYLNTALYCGVEYSLKTKFFNQASEEVKNEDGIVVDFSISSGSDYLSDDDIEKFKTNHVLKVSKAGNVTIKATISDDKGHEIKTRSIDFPLKFEITEKPDYEIYIEPNVKHVLIKTVETEELLKENSDYLCVGEQVWCIGNNTLYIKAKAANGNIVLFPLNSDSGKIDTDSGSTTISVTEGDMEIITDDATITVDDEGYLVLNGYNVDENGMLILTDKKEN